MTIKVLSLNVWIGGILLDRVIEFLRRENADLVLLQEVFAGQDSHLTSQYRTLSELLAVLDYQYHHFAPAFIESVAGHRVIQGNAILSRFPLTEVAVRFYDVPFGERLNDYAHFAYTPRNLQHVVAELGRKPGEKQLSVLNTQGIWGEDGYDSPRRLAMAKTIVDETAGRQPLVLAGDLNVREETLTVHNIQKYLVSVFHGQLQTSFNVKRKDLKKFPGYAQSVVDMMFISPQMELLSHWCPQVDVSDHLPLVIEVGV